MFAPALANPGKAPLAEKITAQSGNLTFFIYHHFGDKRYPTTNVAMADFVAQMRYLADNKYHVIPLAEAVQLVREKRPILEKTAVITIDDGYKSIYSEAWPVLKSFGFPFTVFLYPEGIEKGYSNYLSWKQILEMQAAGVDFQDHSYSHYRLADRPKGMGEPEYRQWIRADLARGLAVLQDRLGRKPRYFAIPYGEYNSIVMEEAKATGYEAIFSQDPGSVSSDTDVFCIPREPILGKEWASLSHFVSVLGRVDLPIAEMTPSIAAPRQNATPPVIGARLLHPERYVQSSFGIYVSELGWQQASNDKGFVSIKNTRPLTRRLNRIMISAREKDTGRLAVRVWLLMQP
ncbi:MAG TPA: polysaccharide deacetylase family protein [Deltaproteobacteria bacterium]|nr:polysaccharide deacetylase family protein [Deltaproteobacteria bacterium]